MTFSVGLTGGAGSGKSTVMHLFEKEGIDTVSADQIAHQLTQSGSDYLSKIIEHFGSSILDDSHNLNRKKLGELIFHDPCAKKWLEQLLHPPILNTLMQRIQKSQTAYIIAEVPLLFETNFHKKVDRTLLIATPIELQIERLVKQRGYEKLYAKRLIKQQCKPSDRLIKADDVITNTHTLVELKKDVMALHQKYLHLSQQN